MSLEKLRRIDENRLEVPKGYKPGMRTNGIIFVDSVLEKGLESGCIDQVANVATLPGIVGSSSPCRTSTPVTVSLSAE